MSSPVREIELVYPDQTVKSLIFHVQFTGRDRKTAQVGWVWLDDNTVDYPPYTTFPLDRQMDHVGDRLFNAMFGENLPSKDSLKILLDAISSFLQVHLMNEEQKLPHLRSSMLKERDFLSG